MVDEKITDLTALTGASLATGDLLVAVDVSDTTMAATGTNKKMTASELAIGLASVKPPSRSVSDAHTDTTVVNTTVETTLATLAIPTTAAAGDAFHVVLVGDMLNNIGSAVTYTFKVILGATTAITSNALSIATSVNRRTWRMDIDMLVVATNDQRLAIDGMINNSTAGWLLGTGTASGAGRGTAVEDLTAGKNLQLSVTMNNANANADCVCHEAVLEVAKR